MEKEILKNEVMELAYKINVKVNRIYVRPMANKWASITTDGKIMSLNKELLSKDISFIRYVISHELIHIKVPNHGKLFKSLLRVYVKNYKKYFN